MFARVFTAPKFAVHEMLIVCNLLYGAAVKVSCWDRLAITAPVGLGVKH